LPRQASRKSPDKAVGKTAAYSLLLEPRGPLAVAARARQDAFRLMQSLGQAGADQAQFLGGCLATGAQPGVMRPEIGNFLGWPGLCRGVVKGSSAGLGHGLWLGAFDGFNHCGLHLSTSH
jgi:hypothetical protein